MTRARPGTGQTALVTGASSGIGAALALQIAAAGFDLVLVARSVDKLEALADRLQAEHAVRVRVQPADLSAPGAATKLAAALKRSRRCVDLLVNNAGVLEHGDFVSMKPTRHRELIDLNVTALTEMLACFVPPMVTRGQGRVLNVASIAAFQPIPRLATYAATKAYVLSLSESLAVELEGSGVTVTALCPGITATSMLDRAQAGSAELTTLPGLLVGSAEEVAAEGLRACLRGEVIRVPGVVNRAATVAGRSAPRWLLRSLTGAVVRRLKPG